MLYPPKLAAKMMYMSVVRVRIIQLRPVLRSILFPRQQGWRAARPAGALPRRAGVRLPAGQDARGGVSLHVAQRPLEGLLQVVCQDCDDDACSRSLAAECPPF